MIRDFYVFKLFPTALVQSLGTKIVWTFDSIYLFPLGSSDLVTLILSIYFMTHLTGRRTELSDICTLGRDKERERERDRQRESETE